MYRPVGRWRLELANIFEEVDEEVRKDQFSVFWRQYGKFVVAGATLALALSVGFVWWQDYDFKQRAQSSQEFEQAIKFIAAKKNDEANQTFAKLSESGTSGYVMLARFRAAGIKADAGDHAAAAQIYGALAADDSLDKVYRNLAQLYSIMQRADDGDPAQLAEEVKPLLHVDSAWRFSALELAAALALRQKNSDVAKNHLKALADDPAAPIGLRRRASEMLQAIDGS
jgi:hypothetical protein